MALYTARYTARVQALPVYPIATPQIKNFQTHFPQKWRVVFTKTQNGSERLSIPRDT